MYAFEFVKPKTVEEAVAALADEEAQALGGGQTLLPTLRQRLAQPGTLVSAVGHRRDQGRGDEGGRARHRRRHHPRDGGARGEGALSGARLAGGADRRPARAQPRHHRRQPRQQRPLGLLPGGGAGVGRDDRDHRAARSRPTTSSRACSRPRSSRARSSPRCASRSRRRRATRSSSSRPRASRWSRSSSRSSPDGVRVAVTGASESGVFRWTEAEAALSGSFSPEAVKGMKPRRPTA